MQGKKIKNGALESALDTFLAEKEYLVMGFEKDASNVYHRVFKDRLDNYALMSPVFAMNGALYLRRLFAKGAQIILMLRPCEIRSYVNSFMSIWKAGRGSAGPIAICAGASEVALLPF
jgi:hypothetical protein